MTERQQFYYFQALPYERKHQKKIDVSSLVITKPPLRSS
jgi:hypothetical protein